MQAGAAERLTQAQPGDKDYRHALDMCCTRMCGTASVIIFIALLTRDSKP